MTDEIQSPILKKRNKAPQNNNSSGFGIKLNTVDDSVVDKIDAKLKVEEKKADQSEEKQDSEVIVLELK